MGRRPVIIITRQSVQYYPSVRDASIATGISAQRILRGLASEHGEIPRTRPVVCVDEPVTEPESG